MATLIKLGDFVINMDHVVRVTATDEEIAIWHLDGSAQKVGIAEHREAFRSYLDAYSRDLVAEWENEQKNKAWQARHDAAHREARDMMAKLWPTAKTHDVMNYCEAYATAKADGKDYLSFENFYRVRYRVDFDPARPDYFRERRNEGPKYTTEMLVEAGLIDPHEAIPF